MIKYIKNKLEKFHVWACDYEFAPWYYKIFTTPIAILTLILLITIHVIEDMR